MIGDIITLLALVCAALGVVLWRRERERRQAGFPASRKRSR
jgi:hypothetical protein